MDFLEAQMLNWFYEMKRKFRIKIEVDLNNQVELEPWIFHWLKEKIWGHGQSVEVGLDRGDLLVMSL